MSEYLKTHKLISKSQIKSSNGELKDDLTEVESEVILKGRVTALFFSASWCPPCYQFLPVLKTFYNELKESGNDFEIVFVSLDHTNEAMLDYYCDNHGNWLAFPFDNAFKDEMINKFHITTIPKLVVIRKNGEIITLKGRKDIQDKGAACFRNWLNNSIPKEDLNKLPGETTDLKQKGVSPTHEETVSAVTDVLVDGEVGDVNSYS